MESPIKTHKKQARKPKKKSQISQSQCINEEDDVVFVPIGEPEIIQIDSDNEYVPASALSITPAPTMEENLLQTDIFFEDKTGKSMLNVPQYSLISDTSLTFSQDDKKVAEIEDGEIISQPTEPCDESVVFISEKPGPSKLHDNDFISLYQELWYNDKQKEKRNNVKRQKKASTDSDGPKTKSKRMVVLDGSNISIYGGLDKGFCVKRLKIAIDFFEEQGHEVKAVVPQFRVKPSKSSDHLLLERLAREGKVILTPCKNLPGMCVSSYDDR